MNQPTVVTISLIVAALVMINSAPVVHAQSIFPVPPPPTSQPPTTFVQPCVNNGSNVLGKDSGKQIVNQENQCTGQNVNQLPVAIATTPSPVVSPGSPVMLDGSGSFAQNGAAIVSYSWLQTAGQSVGVLPNTARPVFIAPQVSTTLAFSLTVTDSRGAVSSAATVTVMVSGSNINQPPVANAGPNQAVSQGSLVTLVGTGSTASSGAMIVSYQWVQTSGTPVSLNGANTATRTFTAPTVATSLTFSLTVTDSNGAVSSPATVTVTVS
jgi:large repetitive protein